MRPPIHVVFLAGMLLGELLGIARREVDRRASSALQADAGVDRHCGEIDDAGVDADSDGGAP